MCANKMEARRKTNIKKDFMRGENASNWEYGTSHVCAFEYTSHSIKQMAREGHKNKSCETRGSRTKREQRGRDLVQSGRVDDKVTKRAHKQKKAQVGKRFHERERVGEYNNDGVRANNEDDDKSGNNENACAERTLFERGGI